MIKSEYIDMYVTLMATKESIETKNIDKQAVYNRKLYLKMSRYPKKRNIIFELNLKNLMSSFFEKGVFIFFFFFFTFPDFVTSLKADCILCKRMFSFSRINSQNIRSAIIRRQIIEIPTTMVSNFRLYE